MRDEDQALCGAWGGCEDLLWALRSGLGSCMPDFELYLAFVNCACIYYQYTEIMPPKRKMCPVVQDFFEKLCDQIDMDYENPISAYNKVCNSTAIFCSSALIEYM